MNLQNLNFLVLYGRNIGLAFTYTNLFYSILNVCMWILLLHVIIWLNMLVEINLVIYEMNLAITESTN